jgi:DDB1- and CUL4-associated factor 11
MVAWANVDDDDESELQRVVQMLEDDSSSDEEWLPTAENDDDDRRQDDDEHEHETEDNEPEDEDDEEEEETVEVWVPSAAAGVHAVLPTEVRATVERVFAGQTFMPMRFVKTDAERRQQKHLLNERIAHQLKSYETDDARMAPLPAMQRRSKNGRSRQMFYALAQREQCGRNSKAQLIKLQDTFLPFQQHKHCKAVDYVGERLYCGGFNSTGTRFLVAGQVPHILLYDTISWKRHSLLPAREVQWTVTDAKFMPDDQHVLYSSITSNVRMVNVDYANTRREEVFSINRPYAQGGHPSDLHFMYRSRCGVWCLDVNAAGTEFVAGTSNNSVVLYDMETKTPVCHVEGHDDDVNAIAFVDGPLHSNVFVSGSDDALIKLWDRRVLSESNPKPQGVFPGHIDGVTYIASRDDGYYFLSNAKDQTAKLWDLRKCFSATQHDRLPYFRKPHHWDYRYQDFPGLRKLPVSHPQDRSVMTYRGHLVMETLVRCHFSPLHTTAQKYIFSGSADGRVYVYDTLTGDLVEIFAMKPDGLTRDVRWHPFEPTIVSPDFYGKLCVWQRQE